MILKKSLFCLALCLINIVSAQDANYKDKIIEFIKLTGATSTFELTIDQIGGMIATDKKDAYTKEAKGTLEGLYNKMAELYMQEFTEEDINQLITFFKSPVGSKMASKQTKLFQSSMSIGQTWAIELQQIAQKYIE